MCPTARDFFARQGDLTQQYFVYCKENQRSMAEKDPLFGLVDIFQTGTKVTTLLLLLPQSMFCTFPQASSTLYHDIVELCCRSYIAPKPAFSAPTFLCMCRESLVAVHQAAAIYSIPNGKSFFPFSLAPLRSPKFALDCSEPPVHES